MTTKKNKSAKRKTTEQKIENAVCKAFEKQQQGHVITNCNFAGVQFDKAATEAITTIAEGLVENAKALGQLAYVLKASNVELETMLKIERE